MENPEVIATTQLRAPGIDWAAILAGATVAAGIGVVFHAFGAALGLGTITVGTDDSGFDAGLVIAGFWTVLTLILTYMAGGYVAGRMRRRGEGVTDDETGIRDGVHGLVVWALGMVITGWLAVSLIGATASTVGSVAGAVAEGAGTTVAAGVEAAGQAMAGETDEALVTSIGDRLSRPGPATFAAPDATVDRAELTRQSAAILADVARTGEISDEDRSFLTAATTRVSGVAPDVAEARTEAAITAAQDLRAKAEELAASAEADALAAAETARKAAVLTAFLLAAASLAAGAAAVAGGVYGGGHRDESRYFAGFAFRRF